VATGPIEPPPPDGPGCMPGPIGALFYMLVGIVMMVAKTIAFTKNWVFYIDNNRKGTIRSACFLLVFTIVHAGGNFIDLLAGPDSTNGEGYFFDRFKQIPTGFDFKTMQITGWSEWLLGPVDLYLFMGLLLHVSVALKRTYDINIGYCLYTGKLNMAISGLGVLTFLIKHLTDLEFYQHFGYVYVRPAPYLINFGGLMETPPMVWVNDRTDTNIPLHKVRDLYSREVDMFKDFSNVLFYTAAVSIFVYHMVRGWEKMVGSDMMQIPKGHVTTVKYIGWLAAFGVGSMYLATPVYIYNMPVDVANYFPPNFNATGH